MFYHVVASSAQCETHHRAHNGQTYIFVLLGSSAVFICKLEIVTPTVPHTQISEIFDMELEIGVQR